MLGRVGTGSLSSWAEGGLLLLEEGEAFTGGVGPMARGGEFGACWALVGLMLVPANNNSAKVAVRVR